MKKLSKYMLLPALAGSCLWACENDGYLYRDVSPRIWLGSVEIASGNLIYLNDSVNFSFRQLDDDVLEGTTYFVAHLIGQTADVDREFTLEVVAGETNAPSSAYTLGATVMPAGEFETLVPVHLKRAVEGLDLTDVGNGVKARLKLRVVPNENFLNGVYEYRGCDRQEFLVLWCDYLTKPVSWSSFITGAIGEFSQARYKFYIDVTGETELTRYDDNSTTRSALQAALRKALQAYNLQADLDDRPHYRDDDGSDLSF